MQTQRIVSGCVMAVFILFSCQHQTNSKEVGNSPVSANDHDTVTVIADPPLVLAQYANEYIAGATTRFTASSKKISVITGRKGLKVTVDPSVLEKEDGSAVDGNISVSIIELTSSGDLFKANAATVSDGRLLASGGSYFIGMECNGQQLRVKKRRSIQVDFPLVKNGKMELFYGERNEADMNWKRAGISLKEKEETIDFTRDNTNDAPAAFFKIDESHIYPTLNETVYYYDKILTIRQLVDTVNRYRQNIYIETVSLWPRNLPTDRRIDSNYLRQRYGPVNQYRLKTCRSMEKEQEAIQKRKEAIEKWQPVSLAGQLQKYYAPSAVTALGWINCDMFYDFDKTEVELDIPVTFNNSRVDYFVILKSVNGLLSSRLYPGDSSKAVIGSLPVGEKVTLLAFVKKEGIIYQGKEDFVVQKNKKLPVDFKTITGEELKKIFSSNVKI